MPHLEAQLRRHYQYRLLRMLRIRVATHPLGRAHLFSLDYGTRREQLREFLDGQS